MRLGMPRQEQAIAQRVLGSMLYGNGQAAWFGPLSGVRTNGGKGHIYMFLTIVKAVKFLTRWFCKLSGVNRPCLIWCTWAMSISDMQRKLAKITEKKMNGKKLKAHPEKLGRDGSREWIEGKRCWCCRRWTQRQRVEGRLRWSFNAGSQAFGVGWYVIWGLPVMGWG